MGAPQDQKEITMEKTLVLIRGIPGSGKTTLAKELADGVIEHPHFETDNFFTNPYTGEYRFKPELIKVAHQWCQSLVFKALLDECPKVIVSNTFTELWELEPYLNMAKDHGYEVEIVTVEGRYKNVHGVPDEKVRQMEQRFQSIIDLDAKYFDILTEWTKKAIQTTVFKDRLPVGPEGPVGPDGTPLVS